MLRQSENSPRILRSMPRAPDPLTARQLFYQVKSDIASIQRNGGLVYESIEPAVGQLVAARLDEDPEVESTCVRLNYNPVRKELTVTMPTWICNSHSSWMKTELGFAPLRGFFDDEEWERLKFAAGTSFHSFSHPYQAAWKQPDLFLGVKGLDLPTIVFEVGWYESHPRLISDKDLWLQGGANHVNIVFLIVWTKVHKNEVKGFLEVFRRGGASKVYTIFPAPAPGSPNQTIDITRAELYGVKCDPNKNASDSISLQMDRLRRDSEDALHEEGYRPMTDGGGTTANAASTGSS